jgi:hypothetical protein
MLDIEVPMEARTRLETTDDREDINGFSS